MTVPVLPGIFVKLWKEKFPDIGQPIIRRLSTQAISYIPAALHGLPVPGDDVAESAADWASPFQAMAFLPQEVSVMHPSLLQLPADQQDGLKPENIQHLTSSIHHTSLLGSRMGFQNSGCGSSDVQDHSRNWVGHKQPVSTDWTLHLVPHLPYYVLAKKTIES